MSEAATTRGRRVLIVTANAVMAEDLKDLLSDFGNVEVDTRESLEEAFEDVYDLALFEVPVATLMHDVRVRDLRSVGASIIVVEGVISGPAPVPAGFQRLLQPFRTEDVLVLLRRLGFEHVPA